MRLVATALPCVVVVEPAVFADDRGWFMESWNQARFDAGLAGLGLPTPRAFVQDNHSCSRAGVLRGLHYQLPPHAQGKLVRVTRGRVFDVAVDLRRTSPSFGRWVGVELSAENHQQLWVPVGFAHGFLTLSDSADVLYKASGFWSRDCERSLRWDDPDLAIDWPLQGLAGQPPLLAPKDAAAPGLAAAVAAGDCFA